MIATYLLLQRFIWSCIPSVIAVTVTGTTATAATVPVNTSYSDTATDSHVITSFLTTFPQPTQPIRVQYFPSQPMTEQVSVPENIP